MKKGLLSLLLLCISLPFFFSSCGPIVGKGKILTDNRTVSSFNAIDIDAPVKSNITVTPGAQPSVVLNGYENIIKIIKVRVEGNTLHIYTDNFLNLSSDKDVSAEITVPSLSSLSISGASDANINGNISGSDFSLHISGVGKVNIANVNVSSLSAHISGAGDVTINSGSVNTALYQLSGTGSVSAFNLQTQQSSATVSGAGDIELNVQKQLDAHISGAGSIRYKGHPVISSGVSGIGKLTDAN